MAAAIGIGAANLGITVLSHYLRPSSSSSSLADNSQVVTPDPLDMTQDPLILVQDYLHAAVKFAKQDNWEQMKDKDGNFIYYEEENLAIYLRTHSKKNPPV